MIADWAECKTILIQLDRFIQICNLSRLPKSCPDRIAKAVKRQDMSWMVSLAEYKSIPV
jgi:hypothetical protein